ncbi:hypothetical protein VSX56_03680 [Thioclava sp. CPCC 100088]|uniref:DUF2946 domain-containing protein n=2 Tax=Thioclava kandeliae TaxID=3070818 RepID=A0ABV1SD77_9RHOB
MKTLRLLPFVTILLVTVFALTSLEFASARGQTRAAGQIVLCSGQGLVTVTVDAGGTPIRHVKICPDMALGLLASLGVNPPVLHRPDGMHRLDATSPLPVEGGHAIILPKARDPPETAA